MKATDLMIGDWVLKDFNYDSDYEFDNVCYKQYQIRDGEDIDLSCETNMLATDSIYRPIPLTEKILEKNSFMKIETIEYPSHSVGISFLYRNTPEGLRIFVQNACTGGPTCTTIKTCKYVHEVQHMIKMCDIERAFIL